MPKTLLERHSFCQKLASFHQRIHQQPEDVLLLSYEHSGGGCLTTVLALTRLEGLGCLAHSQCLVNGGGCSVVFWCHELMVQEIVPDAIGTGGPRAVPFGCSKLLGAARLVLEGERLDKSHRLPLPYKTQNSAKEPATGTSQVQRDRGKNQGWEAGVQMVLTQGGQSRRLHHLYLPPGQPHHQT